MVSHDDGNQVKGAKNTLEKGELDFEGVLLIMGLGQIASETLVPKETVHKIAPDRDDTERGAEAALVVDARSLKMSPMTGGKNQHAVEGLLLQQLIGVGRHRSRIHVAGMRSNQGNQASPKILRWSIVEIPRYLPPEGGWFSRVPASCNDRVSNFFRGHEDPPT
jgi:hypothetical protein